MPKAKDHFSYNSRHLFNFSRPCARRGGITMKKIIVFLLTTALVCSSFAGCSPKAEADKTLAITPAQAVDIIYNASIKYSDTIIKEDIDAAYKEVHDASDNDELVTKGECYGMLVAAFDLSAEPIGNNKRIGIFEEATQSHGINGEDYLTQINSLGILTQNEKLYASTMTTIELERVLSKIYTYIGTNKNDDFYTAINKKWFDTAKIPAGLSWFWVGTGIELENDNRIEKIILNATASNPKKGTVQQKIRDFYISFTNLADRNAKGLKPIQKYINMIDGTATIEELVSLDTYFNQTLGIDALLSFYIMNDSKDSMKNSFYYLGLPIGNEKPDYLEPGEGFTEAYLEYLSSVLGFFGEGNSEAQAVYNLEKEIAQVSLEPEDYYDTDKYYNPYKISELSKMFTGFDFEKYMEAHGYGETNTVIVFDEGAVKRSAELMTMNNLAVLKSILKISIFESFQSVLGEAQGKPGDILREKAYGVEGEKTLKQKAVAMVSGNFPDYVGELYVKEYFPESAKTDVETMVAEFIDEYKSILGKNTWLSKETKDKAIEKLSAIDVKIGYPETWDSTLDDILITPDSIFDNLVAVALANDKKSKEELYQPVDKSKWIIPTFEVNAFYDPSVNGIIFPAGVLQGEFYNVDRDREENLGAIGTIIAHEITHSFDNNGSKYDKDGNANDWWTPKDKAKFEEKCSKMIALFDGIEFAPGIFSNGTLTLSENIADTGGVKCALAVCKKNKDSDLKKFFESYAQAWRDISTRESIEYYSKVDVHSPSKLRVNRVLGSVEEFYSTYGIKEGDDMYVPEELRVTIW